MQVGPSLRVLVAPRYVSRCECRKMGILQFRDFLLLLMKIRDMKLQTVVHLENPSFQIDYRKKLFMVGSCFVENIGTKLSDLKFQTEVNPCGVVYNPLSVAETLEWVLTNKLMQPDELVENHGRWVSFRHHGSFSSVSKEECLSKINNRLQKAVAHLHQTDVLWMTWGTAWIYSYKSTNQIVSNCHRFPSSDFERRRCSIEEIVDVYADLLQRLWTMFPHLKIVVTVSPIRHWKDGAHGNQLSKAILLLAIERLQEQFHDLFYFPSYELVMDELRDYRFYGEDMLHLSAQGVEYIWEKFRNVFMTEQTQLKMQQVERYVKTLQHRPFVPDSKDTNELYTRTQQELRELLKHLYAVG